MPHSNMYTLIVIGFLSNERSAARLHARFAKRKRQSCVFALRTSRSGIQSSHDVVASTLTLFFSLSYFFIFISFDYFPLQNQSPEEFCAPAVVIVTVGSWSLAIRSSSAFAFVLGNKKARKRNCEGRTRSDVSHGRLSCAKIERERRAGRKRGKKVPKGKRIEKRRFFCARQSRKGGSTIQGRVRVFDSASFLP